jgi:hypothetical protein
MPVVVFCLKYVSNGTNSLLVVLVFRILIFTYSFSPLVNSYVTVMLFMCVMHMGNCPHLPQIILGTTKFGRGAEGGEVHH